MSLTRRRLLKIGSIAAVQGMFMDVSGCKSDTPLPRLLKSRIPLPDHYKVTLPRLQVLAPSTATEIEDQYNLTAAASTATILPGVSTLIWGFNGSFPGPTIEVKQGRPAVIRLTNELQVPIVNHLHGGRTPPEHDGYPTDLLLPKRHWTGGHMHDPSARITRETRSYIYANQQRAATLWYHDHRMDFTGPQVWRGLFGFYIIREPTEEKLGLPKGEKEVPLMICDRSFDADGSLLYPAAQPELVDHPGVTHAYMGGVLGDVMLVNGVPWPKMEVSNTRYRFRLLNASNARRLNIAIEARDEDARKITQIGSDGGLLARPVIHSTLPIAPAERFDIVLDFSGCKVGERVAMRNTEGQGRTSEIMCFDVVRSEPDLSQVPEQLADFEVLRPEMAIATRSFRFSYGGMAQGWLINGKAFDPSRIDARPKLDSVELWHLHADRSHPLHLHLAHFQVLSNAGTRRDSDGGWKDTINMNSGETASVLVRFSGHRGRYVFHCHNLEHEDMAMMANFEVV
jgi:spore coat protein A, manganese oxidase